VVRALTALVGLATLMRHRDDEVRVEEYASNAADLVVDIADISEKNTAG